MARAKRPNTRIPARFVLMCTAAVEPLELYTTLYSVPKIDVHVQGAIPLPNA